MRVGIAGLGLMGSGIATRLVSTGHTVWVYNRSREKTKSFSKMAAIASTPAELAKNCDLVITVVTDFEACKDILLGKNGIVNSGNCSVTVADVSTVSPSQSAYCAKALREEGIEMLGMPVMGGPGAAETGDLVPIIAGSRQAFERARQVIEKLGRVFYIGEVDGTANVIKLALNLNIALVAIALSEGITLLKGSGVDPSLFVQILNSTYFKTGLSEKKGPKMVKNDFAPSFYLRNMLKDLELANGTAQVAGVTLPLTSLAQQFFRAANNCGFSDQDYTSICGFLEKINGMQK